MPSLFGIAFPFTVGSQTFPKSASDEDIIEASVIQIVTTAKGERVMRPGFGCNAFDLVFENDSEAFRGMVEQEIRQSIMLWEPRVRVDAVDVTSNENTEPGQRLITITYTIISSGLQNSTTIAG